MKDLQTELYRSGRGAIMALDSAADIVAGNAGTDVVVTASYLGVLPARLLREHLPRAAVGFDGGVGPEGSAIAGLWYLEALNVPACTADVSSVILGDGVDVFENGVVSFLNRPAQDCGVRRGMPVREAAMLMLEGDPGEPGAYQVTNRQEMYSSPTGHRVIVTDSIVFGTAEDVNNVLVTAGHTGRSGARHILKVHPYAFICSDGGRGRDDSGMAGLAIVAAEAGIPGATVDGTRARLGDGMSTYRDGVISAVNEPARDCGVAVGMAAAEAARRLADSEREA
jgi:uncharacterized protein YunC (DUF1805 family)